MRGTALARHWDRAAGARSPRSRCSPRCRPDEMERERRAHPERAPDPRGHAVPARLRRGDGGPVRRRTRTRGPSLGRRESVERIDRAALLAHYAAHLSARPHGARRERQSARRRVMRELAERLFGAMPAATGPAPVSRARPRPPARGPPRRRAARRSRRRSWSAYLGPPLTARRLRGGARARHRARRRHVGAALHRAARPPGLAYSVGTLSTSARARRCSCTLPRHGARRTPRPAEAGVRAEIERIRARADEPSASSRAPRRTCSAQLAMDRRTNARHAWYLAFFEVHRRGLGVRRPLRARGRGGHGRRTCGVRPGAT